MKNIWIKKIRHLFFFNLFATLLTGANAASFDCSKASTTIEHMICSNHDLSEVDDKLAKAFASANIKDPILVSEQRNWLREDRNKCQTIECLKSSYNKRVYALKENNSCSIKEDDLLGRWSRVKGSGFEEMDFSIQNGKKAFMSWLHHRPEMTGTWIVNQCMLYVRHATEENIEFEFKLQKLEKNFLHIFEMEYRTNVIYKKMKVSPG